MTKAEIMEFMEWAKEQIALNTPNNFSTATDIVKALREAEYRGYMKAVAERPQGEWIDRSDGGRILNPWWESCECSQCGEWGSGAWSFCPHCGAKMCNDETLREICRDFIGIVEETRKDNEQVHKVR